jgi:periplasmic protein TonB
VTNPSRLSSIPDPDQKALDKFLARPFEDTPIWAGLYENLRDTLFPAKLPPLELTSAPIPTPDRMASRTNPWAVGGATVLNAGVMALLLYLGLRVVSHGTPATIPHGKIDLADISALLPHKSSKADGGGSGGNHSLIDPMIGGNPRLDLHPQAPPMDPVLDRPTIALNSAIAVPPDVKLPDNPNLPNIGVNKSPNVKVVSAGTGSGHGLGLHSGNGDGDGDGDGFGPGGDRGFNGGVYSPGVGGVSDPIPLVTPEAEFSDEARRHKAQGIVMISVIVDAQGNPRDPRVTRALGMGLDEKAIEAVMRYRFKPAKKDGKPVAVRIGVLVNFRLY